MHSGILPDGWQRGRVLSPEEAYEIAPVSPDPARLLLYGAMADDTAHHIYTMPADTQVADIVRAFAVGTHGAQSYGWDASATVELVAARATAVAEALPCRVTFADAAGLKLWFTRPVTEDDLTTLQAIFREDDDWQSGLEIYETGWDGESHLFAPVMETNVLHLWWD